MIRLVGTVHRNTQVVGLLGGELGQLDVESTKVRGGHLLVQLLGQHVDTDRVLAGVAPDLHLGQNLIGEGVGHDEGGMSHGAAEVDQATLGQHNDVLAVLHGVPVHLGLNVGLGLAVVIQPFHLGLTKLKKTDYYKLECDDGYLDLAVEVANVANDGVVLHTEEVFSCEDVLTAGGGDEDVAPVDCFVNGGDLISFHAGLEGVDGV